MKKLSLLATAGILTLAFGLAACGGLRNATALGTPRKAEPLTYAESNAMDPALKDAAAAFAAKFSAAAVRERSDNAAVSPLSVYFALGLAAECAAGSTKEELLTALDVDDTTLKSGYSDLFRSVIAEYKSNLGGNMGRVDVGNSIWLQKGVSFKEDCITTLADDYLCYSYAADFAGENGKANDAVRDFVKGQTNGLIDRDFKFSEETVFTIVNTLYCKDMWNLFGDDLPFAEGEYSFTQGGGEKKNVRLLEGYYTSGRAYEGETFTHYHADTIHGCSLKFLVPKEGHTVGEIFTEENLALVSEMKDYRPIDEENKLEYHTRCLFPEFGASFDGDVKAVLMDFGVNALFTDECDLSALTDEKVYCEELRHVVKVDVTRKGIEGAAVTMIPGAGASGPGDYTVVEEDFVLDRAFGFVITDKRGAVLFSGIVNEVNA